MDKDYCKKCGGFQYFTGIVYTSYPEQYGYKCERCWNWETISKSDHFGEVNKKVGEK